ncbi:MAG TPA: CoA transferase [Ramlibacter sp.]|nr:CoA transferase [Ramlibacter sp.]
MKGPLVGLKVLDASTVVAGGFASSMLGDMGAEVIKVENPQGGDSNREMAPRKDGVSLWHKVTARNKKSITLDLRQSTGQDLFRQLCAKADVVIENFRAGTMEKWGLGYEALSAANPGLVMLRISGYGQDGPYAHRSGFGTVAEVMSGLTARSGFPDSPPQLSSIPLADEQSGMFGAYAILAAIFRRDHATDEGAGKGQVIDIALYEPLFRMIEEQVINYDQLGQTTGRIGNRMLINAPRGLFKTKDERWVAISAFTQSTVNRLCRVIGGDALVNDPRIQGAPNRVANVEWLEGVIGGWMARHTEEEILAVFEREDVVGCGLWDVQRIMDDPQFLHRGNIVKVQDPQLGEVRVHGVVPKFSDTPGAVNHLGVPLGQNNDEIYRDWLGLGEAEIRQLQSREVI